jgi:hypothetical protein
VALSPKYAPDTRGKRGGIAAAILDSGNESAEFARQFNCLAQALSTDMGESDLLNVRRCILWLTEKSEPYTARTHTPLLKRLNLIGILTGIGKALSGINLLAGAVLSIYAIVGIVTD